MIPRRRNDPSAGASSRQVRRHEGHAEPDGVRRDDGARGQHQRAARDLQPEGGEQRGQRAGEAESEEQAQGGADQRHERGLEDH
jgi:hypothetical protein